MIADYSTFVALHDVTRTFVSGSQSVAALSEVSLSIGKGERLALLGRSGSGKSTLLNLLGGLDRPTSGSITVDNQDLSKMSKAEIASYRLHSVGMIFQAFNLIATKTVLQNIALPFVFAGQPRAARNRRALEALELVGLQDRAHHRPHELSGGEQQRVAIVRALANDPSLLLADEPTGNLDSATATEIMANLIEFSESRNTAVVLVTHDEELASTFAHRTIRLFDGRLIDAGVTAAS